MIEHVIPPITDPMGRHWVQPKREDIVIDEQHAFMNEQAFKRLAEYSTTIPSGVYPGKMWKAELFDAATRRPSGVWELRWFGIVPGNDKVCSNNSRKILIYEEVQAIAA